MKKSRLLLSAILLIILALAIFVAFSYKTISQNYFKYIYSSSCDIPLTYKIGDVDTRFNISNAELLSRINEAAQIWSDAKNRFSSEKKNLFLYDQTGGKISVNLIYDTRQSLSTKINTLEDQLNTKSDSLDNQVIAYNQRLSDYEKRVAQLTTEIKYWNKKGGAPKDVYNNLTQRMNDLKQERQELMREAVKLNQSTSVYNTQVGDLNATITNLNQELTQKPEEGLYDPKSNKIDIYISNSKDEMIHTLTHEFGHVLGIGHVNSPDAIMYYLSNQRTTLSKDDLNELTIVCKNGWFPFAQEFLSVLRIFRS